MIEPATPLVAPEPAGLPARRPQAREAAKILSDCRDLAVHRLVLSFSGMLDRVGDMLVERANRSLVREETATFLEARRALNSERAEIMSEFERRLRGDVDKLISGEPSAKADFSKVDATNLTLIDTSAMDESVLTGNIKRGVENACHDELLTLNRGMGHLLGRPDLETDSNPLAPAVIVEAFAAALRGVKAEDRVKLAILRELNQGTLGDLNAIYADLNKHLINLRVVPTTSRMGGPGRRAATQRPKPWSAATGGVDAAPPAGPEVDLMSLFRQMHGAPQAPRGFPAAERSAPYAGPPTLPPAGMQAPGGGGGGGGGVGGGGSADPGMFWMFDNPQVPVVGNAFDGAVPGHAPASGAPGGAAGTPGGVGGPFGGPLGGGAPQGARPGSGPAGTGGAPDVRFLGIPDAAGTPFPPLDAAAGPRYVPAGPLPTTPSGYVPGAPIMATQELGEGLNRLQAGETSFDLGDGTLVRFTGIPQGKRNVLRDLQESPLGQRVNQLESMTIELVAMLFDFIFETRDLPDGIKALLARLQIPVLKAAMLDGAFFAKKSHPSRVLVNALAQAGLGWSAEMGHEDPLYRKLHGIVHRVLDEFTDNLAIFEELRADLEQFLADEEKAAEANIQATAVEIHEKDRVELAPIVARMQTERRIETYPVPNFLAAFLRLQWVGSLEKLYLNSGEESEAWDQAIATIEDLVWSVQPKRTRDDRRHLVALLPSLLKRIAAGMQSEPWPRDDRERFMENLVEAHAAAVKPASASIDLPTAAVAEQARADAEQAKAAGDDAGAVKAEQLAAAMSRAEPAPPVEQAAPGVDDRFLEIAQSLERGMWIEFEGEGGQLAFAKLAWVSPLRGTYLFTNRQGQKALSMTAEELAERFRNDQARLVEAEPLLDQAFTSMMENLGEKKAAANV